MSAPDPNCPDCGGTGSVAATFEPPHPPTFNRCECALRGDILANVERGMKGLTKALPIKKTSLKELREDNLWITSGDEFLSHLRHVGIRMPATWAFRVTTDAELVTAWLATVALNGGEIFDSDAHQISTRFLTIPDLVVPPDLLIIRMGVKVARNAAASEVLGEAINIRFHEDKPTWIWDQPGNPLGMGHLFWSDAVARILRPWRRITDLKDPTPPRKKAGGGPKPETPNRRPGRKTLRGSG